MKLIKRIYKISEICQRSMAKNVKKPKAKKPLAVIYTAVLISRALGKHIPEKILLIDIEIHFGIH